MNYFKRKILNTKYSLNFETLQVNTHILPKLQSIFKTRGDRSLYVLYPAIPYQEYFFGPYDLLPLVILNCKTNNVLT